MFIATNDPLAASECMLTKCTFTYFNKNKKEEKTVRYTTCRRALLDKIAVNKIATVSAKLELRNSRSRSKPTREILTFARNVTRGLSVQFFLFSVCDRFNKYLCHCLPCFAVCGGRQIDRDRTRSSGAFSQRSRGDMRGTFYDTSFGSTFRRRTQEFNSTAVLEMGSIEAARSIQSDQKVSS